MKSFPASVDEKLGFDLVRERLRALLLSRLGEDRLDAMRPFEEEGTARGELGRVSELQEVLRFDDPLPLQHVIDIRPLLRQLTPEGSYVDGPDLVALRNVLGTMRLLRQYFDAREGKYPHLVRVARHVSPLPEIEERIAEVITDDGRVRDDASEELLRLRRLIVRRQAQLREVLLNELRRAVSQGYATEEQPTIRNGRMVIPVRAEAKRKIQGFVQDSSATGQTVYIEPAAVLDLNNEVRELEAEERREVERILRALASRIRDHLESLRESVRALARFDLLQAKARFANEIDAIVPTLDEAGVIEIRGGRNPVLLLHFRRLREETGAERSVVPLDLTLGGEYRTLVITGPNAGGKTVAMKTVGLFALMLSHGLPLPVDPGSRFPLLDQLMVDIGDQQSIEEDLSTFSSHISVLNEILRRVNERTLVLIDEAGTGTDPAEGGALAQAVLERLTDAGARTIVTTHHGTLKVFAHETEGVENGSMEFDQASLSPTYRFQARIPGSSYAFEIAQRIGLDPTLLSRARALVGTQKTALEELITTFEARNQSLEARVEEVEEALRKAQHERRTYEGRAEKLRKEQDQIRRQALEEAERLVGEANARIERTIREIKEAEAEKHATREAREALEAFKSELSRRRRGAERRLERRGTRGRPPEPASAAQAPVEPTGGSTGPIRVGDQVVLDGGSTAAEVIEVAGKEALIAVDSMKMRVKVDRLQKVGGPRKQRVTVRQLSSGGGGLSSLSVRSRLDLRGQRVDEALQQVTRLVDEAVAANLDHVEILHGKGTGALRAAIHELLAARPDVASFDDAPVDQGGAGVTFVTLR